MKNRIKNLFIAGGMLLSMGLAMVVQAAPAWASMLTIIGSDANYVETTCQMIGGHINSRGIIQRPDGKYQGECDPGTVGGGGSSNNTDALPVWITGSTKEEVENECKSKGGVIDPQYNIRLVAAGVYEAHCIKVDSGNEGGGSGNDDGGNDDGGTDSTTKPQNPKYPTDGSEDGYTYGAGLNSEDKLKTSVLDCGDGANGEGIFCILNIGLTILTWGVGIAGTLGIVITGVQYLTARDSAEQVAKAKSRLINIVIGLVIYAVMWGFLNWLLPGGLF